jgi:hypothetical protein
MGNLVHNERVKYAATVLNNMAVASFTAGLVLPALSSNRPSGSLTSADFLTVGVGVFLKSPSFCSRSQAENPHILRVLALGDEFRERIAFCGSQEKLGKCLAQRVCHDKF